MEPSFSRTICLLSDSFPPSIDGVSNAVQNYASYIEKGEGHAVVVAPFVPGVKDEGYTYPVFRYPSIDTRKLWGYVSGVPLAPDIAPRVQKEGAELLHLHDPMTAAYLARQLKDALRLPLVLTWHTKYDIDLARALKSKLLQGEVLKALIANVNACDEVWTVSRGAGENLRSLGYEGEYVVMENGVDLPEGPVSEEKIREVTGDYDLPEDIPVFLFVGRLMWYKGLQIILDALKVLKEEQIPFRMVFVGTGGDEKEVKEYTEDLGLSSQVFFTGALRDREALRGWYSRANLFLFPSTFDTNGLVVREAAACHTAAVLIEGSCAAEEVTDGRNGFLIEETSEAMAAMLKKLSKTPEVMKQVGENAGKDLYLSWEEAVGRAKERYEIVIEKHRTEKTGKFQLPLPEFVKAQGVLVDALDRMSATGREMIGNLATERDMILDSFRGDADEWKEMMDMIMDWMK